MTVRQVKTLSPSRLHKAQKYSGLTLEDFAQRVREFHPQLAQTNVKQLTRWHSGQRPRQPELVVAAYADIAGKDETYFYVVDEEDEESRLRHLAAQLVASGGNDDLAAELLSIARSVAASTPMAREEAVA